MTIAKAVRSVVEDASEAIVRALEDRRLAVARRGLHAVLIVVGRRQRRRGDVDDEDGERFR